MSNHNSFQQILLGGIVYTVFIYAILILLCSILNPFDGVVDYVSFAIFGDTKNIQSSDVFRCFGTGIIAKVIIPYCCGFMFSLCSPLPSLFLAPLQFICNGVKHLHQLLIKTNFGKITLILIYSGTLFFILKNL